jgi:hypothetical protein
LIPDCEGNSLFSKQPSTIDLHIQTPLKWYDKRIEVCDS